MVAPAGIIDVISSESLMSADNTWHHMAVTVDAANAIAIYLDGAVVASARLRTWLVGDLDRPGTTGCGGAGRGIRRWSRY